MKKKKLKQKFLSRELKKLFCIMKLIFVFLLLSSNLVLGSQTYAQITSLNLNLTNVELEEVFDAIRRQSEFEFFYNNDQVNTSVKVSVKAKDTDIYTILEQTLPDIYEYKINDRYILISKRKEVAPVLSPEPQPQQAKKTITGTITDKDGEAVIGANIVEKGTTNGTVTDVGGRFSLNVENDAVILISYIGYLTQEVSTVGKTVIDIVLQEDTQALDELVVVGYGTMRKSDLTGAVTRANMDFFKDAPNVNLLQSLQGSVPGLNVGSVTRSGSSPSISIRGSTNFGQNDTPLIVIDGIIYRGDIVDLNPNDIESIDILKDASSTAIYGSESANGVIIITTQKGKPAKPSIQFNSSYTFQSPSNLVEPGDAAWNVKSIADSYWELSRIGPDYLEPNPEFDPAIYFKTEDYRNGYYQWLESGLEHDWWDLLTDNAYIMENNISVGGATDRLNYYYSAGYTNQSGMIRNDDYKRYSFKINLSTDITDWLNIGINSSYSLNDFSGASVNMGELFEYHPLLSPYDNNGELIVRPDGTRLNPLKIEKIDNLDKRENLLGIFHTDIKLPFLKGFNYRMNYSLNKRTSRNYQFDEWAYNLLGEGYKNYSNNLDWTLDNIFSYIRSFDKHNLNLTFVYGVEKRQADFTNTLGRDYTDKTLGYHSLGLGNATLSQIGSNSWEESSLYSMGRAVYNFDDKYLLTGTIRRDGFSGFGKNNKFGVFPSVALGWIMTNESFMENSSDWLSLLKIRLSYGTTGRRALNRYQTLARVSTGYSYIFGDGGSPVIGKWMSSLSNDDLKWETTTGINLGFDYGLFKNRISGSFEYYNTTSKNILYDISLPRLTGFNSISSNIGQIHNHGFEFALNGIIFNGKDFSWDGTLNFSLNRDKIKSIIGADNDNDGIEEDLIADGLFINEPLNVIYGFENIGMWQISDQKAGLIPQGFFPGTYKVRDLNNDGEITTDKDRKILAYRDPGSRISFATTFNYKNLRLQMFFNSIQGGKNHYYSTAYNPPGGNGDNWDNRNKPAQKYYDYWLPENPDAKYSRLDKGSSFNTPLLHQRNFIRLQDISLSYFIPSDVINTINIQSFRIFISGKNLFTWAPQWRHGWDPETGEAFNVNGSPLMKGITLGMNLEF